MIVWSFFFFRFLLHMFSEWHNALTLGRKYGWWCWCIKEKLYSVSVTTHLCCVSDESQLRVWSSIQRLMYLRVVLTTCAVRIFQVSALSFAKQLLVLFVNLIHGHLTIAWIWGRAIWWLSGTLEQRKGAGRYLIAAFSEVLSIAKQVSDFCIREHLFAVDLSSASLRLCTYVIRHTTGRQSRQWCPL